MIKASLMLGVSLVSVLGVADIAYGQPATQTGQQAASLTEVVVTARRRDENVQDVPLAVQVFSPEMLENKGIEEIRDLQQAVPGLNITPGTFRDSTPSMTIRGFQGGGLQIDSDPSIPFIINEVPINTPQGQNAAFFDLQNVQVLKGPQGTLQGRNTVGGAVLITTRLPQLETFDGYVTAGVGNFDSRLIEGAVNIPVGDKLAFRLAARHEERDGTWTNIADGRKYDDKNNTALRLSVLWEVNDDLDNVTIFDRLESDVNGSAIVFNGRGFDAANPATYPANGQVFPCTSPVAALCAAHNIPLAVGFPGLVPYVASEEAHQRSLGERKFDSFVTAARSRFGVAPFEKILNQGVSNTTTWYAGDDLTVKNIIGYREVKSNLYEDIDGTSRGIVPLTGQSVALLETNNILDFNQFTEELQVQGTAQNGLIDWIGGLFYSHYEGTDASDFAQIGSRAFNIYKVEAQSFGLYGQMDVKFTDKLTLTAGYRYTWDDRSAIYQNLSNPRGVNAGINLADSSIGFFGEYGDDIRLPSPLNPQACNFNRQATGTRPALAGVNLADCTARRSLNSDAPTYNITIQYKPTDDVLVYLAHRQGYRAGSLAARATTDEGVINQNEQVRDLELGLKSQFYIADMPSRFNAATYYSWYTNIAVAVSKLDPVTLLSLNQAENSGQAHLYGGEASFDIRPVEGLSLSATYGYTVGVYDAFPSQTVNDALNQPLIFYSNADLEFGYPRHSWTLGATYDLPLSDDLGDVSVSLNYAHFSERPDQKGFFTIPEYGVANARLDWKRIAGRPVDLAVYVNNLADEDYLDAVFSNEDSVGFRAGFPADPRTYGVNLTYRFGG